MELSDDYKDRLEKENKYLKSSKELELSNMQSILEQMDTSNQLRQESMKIKLREIQKLEETTAKQTAEFDSKMDRLSKKE